jgi:hypothetical protein
MYASSMRRLLLATLCFFATPLLAQACPKDIADPPSSALNRTLHGQLIYHNDLRQWFELKLDDPVCGQTSIQLVRVSQSWTPLQTARGCHVTTSGVIGLSPTGYYSLDMYQDVETILPAPGCRAMPPFPDMSHLRPAPDIQRYRVEMDINYRKGDHPIVFHITGNGGALRPWQAYASYDLTGGFVLYGHCAQGFVVDKVFGPAQASPGHSAEPRTADDMAEFDPESAAAPGHPDLKLGYTCIRTK